MIESRIDKGARTEILASAVATLANDQLGAMGVSAEDVRGKMNTYGRIALADQQVFKNGNGGIRAMEERAGVVLNGNGIHIEEQRQPDESGAGVSLFDVTKRAKGMKDQEINAPGPITNSPIRETSVYSPTMLTEKIDEGNRDFYTLREDKFFATQENIASDPIRTALRINRLPAEERSKTINTLDSMRLFLGIEKFSEIEQLLANPKLRQAVSIEACKKIGKMYQIHGEPEDIEDEVKGYADVANKVIDRLRKNELSEYSISVEMMNDVYTTHDPVELLLMTFDNEYAPQARFEAKRKLELMLLIGNIDLREREIDLSGRISEVNEFLAEHVFTPEARKGEVNPVYLLTTHDEETYETSSVQVLDKETVDQQNKTYVDPNTGESRRLNENQKLIRVPRRRFGKGIPIYATNDPKTRESKVLKLVRKGELNPAQAVDDDVRMMGVLDSYQDVHDFMKHFKRSVVNSGSFVQFEGFEDTLVGGARRNGKGAVENGGNPKIKILKFHARFALPNGKPINMEVILHTNASAIDYRFQKGIAHEEFKAKEFFGKDDELSVADLLFPYKFYGIDMKIAREERIASVRETLKRQSTS